MLKSDFSAVSFPVIFIVIGE
jgi:hypothetical protein